MSTAEDRGWGAVGKPGSAVGRAYEAKNIVPTAISDGGRIVTLRVHRTIAPLVKAFLSEITTATRSPDGKAYHIAGGVTDDWGYCHRYMRGSSSKLSNHSWGLAIDINATKNPMQTRKANGSLVTDIPAWVVSAAAFYGFSWGGNYMHRPDPMHFEFLGTPAQATALVKRLGLTP